MKSHSKDFDIGIGSQGVAISIEKAINGLGDKRIWVRRLGSYLLLDVGDIDGEEDVRSYSVLITEEVCDGEKDEQTETGDN